MNVPWEQVRGWAEKRLASIEIQIWSDRDATETARLRTERRIYRELLDLEKGKDESGRTRS